MAFDWITGLFQSEQTRGLSGDSASAVALDDTNPYYNYRLRRHHSDADVVIDPSLLWHTTPFVKDRAGLGVHVAAEQGEGVATFTDVLVILSAADYNRAKTRDAWLAQTGQLLGQEFESHCKREGFHRLYAHRHVGFRFLCDGSEEMGGQTLGLGAGDFVTGLLPNLYTGPVKGSRGVIGVHVNLPGAWEGYQEVGRLYDDQILFTLGSHWLDNFSHPALREAALYRLQQYPDGTFVHIINPDLQDRYQVTSTDQGGASVLTLATRDGSPLAYVVLALLEDAQDGPVEPPTRVAPSPARGQQRAPSAPPDMAPPMLIDDAVQPVAPKRPAAARGSKTIIPDAPSDRIFTFQERGALLQKVHFSGFMEGYKVYVGTRGEVATVMANPAATFTVRRPGVSLTAHIQGVSLGVAALAQGEERLLEGDTVIDLAGQRLEYRDLRSVEVDGWPYVGEIRRPASSTYMVWGQRYKVGRSRECKVVLPDEPRNDNIIWKAKVGDGATIRAKTGEIPKSRFYTDSIMVASEHAEVDVATDAPTLISAARHCYTYIRRQADVLTLAPANADTGEKTYPLLPGDEVLVGNSVFQVGYSAGEAVAPAPAPRVDLSPDSLLNALSDPDFESTAPHIAPPAMLDDLPPPLERRSKGKPSAEPAEPKRNVRDEASVLFDDAPSAPSAAAADRLARARQRPKTEDLPTAAGLGEGGDAPEPVPLAPVGMDSIMGMALGLSPTQPQKSMSLADLRAEEDLKEADYAGPVDSPFDRDAGLDDFGPPPVEAPAASPAALLQSTWDDLPDEAEPTLELPAIEAESPDEAVTADGSAVQAALTAAPPELDAPPPLPELPPAPPVADAPPPLPELPPAPPEVAEAPPALPELPPPAPEAVAELPPELPPAVVAAPEPPPAPEAAPPASVLSESQAPNDDQAGTLAVGSETAFGTVEANGVVVTRDDDAQFEIGRPMHVVLVGWTVKGDATAGNHAGADLILPENRITDEQVFEARDYFKLSVRGRKGTLDVLSPTELLVDEDDPHAETYDALETRIIDVIRRDDQGDEDFAVRLLVREDRALPDPRARLVTIDVADPLAAALVTRGLPLQQPRELSLGPVQATLRFDGESVVISDFLASYRDGAGFKPFFIQQDGGRFRTAPEDGSEIVLKAGDRLVVGTCVYVLRAE